MSKQILIAGVNSFLSKAIHQQHLADVVDGLYYTQPNPNFCKNYSIDNLETIQNSYDIIYIVSAFISNDLNQLDTLLQMNVVDINRICAKFKESRIIFCSSIAVFDAINNGVINDNTIPAAASIYGLTKLMGEQIIVKHPNYGILRISSMYGVGMKSTTFLPKIVAHALELNKITLLGTGARYQNYVHVKDVASLAKKLGEQSKNQTIFAIHPQNYSNKEIAAIVQEQTGCDLQYTGEDHTRSITYHTENDLVNQHVFVDFKQGIDALIQWKRK
jgi:UDP-glucose 4-epimerase